MQSTIEYATQFVLFKGKVNAQVKVLQEGSIDEAIGQSAMVGVSTSDDGLVRMRQIVDRLYELGNGQLRTSDVTGMDWSVGALWRLSRVHNLAFSREAIRGVHFSSDGQHMVKLQLNLPNWGCALRANSFGHRTNRDVVHIPRRRCRSSRRQHFWRTASLILRRVWSRPRPWFHIQTTKYLLGGARKVENLWRVTARLSTRETSCFPRRVSHSIFSEGFSRPTTTRRLGLALWDTSSSAGKSHGRGLVLTGLRTPQLE